MPGTEMIYDNKCCRGGIRTMLLSTKPDSSDSIVAALAVRPGMDVAGVQRQLRDSGMKLSRPQLFRELHELQSGGVIVNIKGQYHLSLAWVTEIIHFADMIDVHYREGSQLSRLLPDDTRRRRWKFFEYCRLSNFWNHLRLALINETGASEMFEWLPHPWQHLIHHEKALLFYKAVGRSGCRLKRIVGNSSYLDRLHVGTWPTQSVDYFFGDSPFADLKNTSIDVIGDYVLEVTIVGKTFSQLEDLYRQVKGKGSLKFERVTSLLYEKGKFSVSLERNQRKAERLRCQFVDFFL